MKSLYKIIICVSICVFSTSLLEAQITFSGCNSPSSLLETGPTNSYTFVNVGTDGTGRNIFQTNPFDGLQSCPLGFCELQISWSTANSRWELVADDGANATAFDGTNLIMYNSAASLPNPPDLTLGTWVDANAGNPLGDCNGTPVSSITGDVQGVLSLNPTITTITRQNPLTSPTNANNVVFRVVFNETVVNVDVSDFNATGTTANVTNVSGSGTTYDVSISGGDLANYNGTVSLAITTGQNIANTGGFALTNTIPTGVNENYLLDNIPPTGYTVAIDQSPINIANTNAVSFTFTGAEVGAIYNYAFTSNGGGTIIIGGSAIIATATDQITGIDLSSLADGTISLSVTLRDTSTNSGGSVTDTESKVTTRPTVSITSTETSPTSVNPIPISILFNKEVSNFIAGDITVGNGTVSNFNTTDNITYTADINPTGANVTVDIAASVAQDLAGNDNQVAPQFSIQYNELDAGITQIISPVTQFDITTNTVEVEVSNLGTVSLNSIPLSISIDFNGSLLGTSAGTLNTTVLPGATSNFTFPDTFDFSNDGNYKITVTTNLINDVDATNDELTDIIGNRSRIVGTLSEDFENVVTTSQTGPILLDIRENTFFFEGLPGWEYDSDDLGIGHFSIRNDYLSGKHLSLDNPGGDSINRVLVNLDLSEYDVNTPSDDIRFFFSFFDHGDERDFIDIVEFRTNENDPFITIYNWGINGVNGSRTNVSDILIDDILRNNGLNFTSTCQLRFTQTDNFPINTDGFSIDNVFLGKVIPASAPAILASLSVSENVSVGTSVGSISVDNGSGIFLIPNTTIGNLFEINPLTLEITTRADVDYEAVIASNGWSNVLTYNLTLEDEVFGGNVIIPVEITIIDVDDTGTVTIANISGSENNGAITVTATLDNNIVGGFTVDVSTTDGTATTADSDYTAISSQTLTFAGTAGETQTFTVTPTADTKVEANEVLSIAMSNINNNNFIASGLDITDTATVTITNDDNAALTIEDVSGAEDDGVITLTATLDNPVDGSFTIDVNTADGSATLADADYTAITSQTLTYIGTAGETKIFTIAPTADTKVELDETIGIFINNTTATTVATSAIDITDKATVTITNDDKAFVTSVIVPADATYIIGNELNFTVIINDPVTVNTVGGTPELSLTIGTTIQNASYISGSGSNSLQFRYTVQEGDLDTDGILVGALNLNGGTIKDNINTNDINPTLNNVANTSQVLVDGIPPRVNRIIRFTPTVNPTNADLLIWEVIFNEAVSDVDLLDFELNGTTANIFSVINTTENRYRITTTGGDLNFLNGTVTLNFSNTQNIRDIAGNSLVNLTPRIENNNTFLLDNSATIAISTPIERDDFINGIEDNHVTISGTTISVEAERIVTLLFTDSNNIVVTATAVVQPDGSWTATNIDISGLLSGSITIDATVTDLLGNIGNDQKTVDLDNLAPVADIPTLTQITSGCEINAITPPTATDNFAGSITATSNATFPITTQGTSVITWTYDDGNGNTATQTQNVVINLLDVLDLGDQEVVGAFTFPTILGDNLSGSEAYYTAANGEGTKFEIGQTIQFTDFSNYPVTVYIYDQSSETCSSQESFLLTITPPLQTGLVFNDATVTYDGAQKALTVTGMASDATVVYENNNQTNAGEYLVTATVSRPNYVTAVLAATLTIEKAVASITADDTQTFTFDGEIKNIVASLNHTETTLTYAPEQGSINVGTYAIEVNAIETANYLAVSKSVTLTIEPALQTDLVFDDETFNYDGTQKVLIVTGMANDATVVYENNNQTNAGEYLVTATVIRPNYITAVLTATLTIEKAVATITAEETQTFTFDGELKEIVAVLNHTETNLVYTTQQGYTNAGTYTITVSAIETANYLATSLEITLVVQKASQTIVFEEIPTKNLENDPDFQLNAIASSGLAVTYSFTFSSALPAANVSEIGFVTLNTSGIIQITATQVGNENYQTVALTRTLNITSANANITRINIDGQLYENPSEQTIYLIECSNNTSSVAVLLEAEINATISTGTSFTIDTPNAGIYRETFTVTSQDGTQTKTYEIIIEKAFQFEEIVDQKYNNTLVVNNNSATNGGFTFVSYQWFKNGVLVSEEQLFSEGDASSDTLDPNASYQVVMVTSTGETLRTCEFTIELATDIGLVILQNPLKQGSLLKVKASFSKEELENAVFNVFDSNGKIIATQTVKGVYNDIQLPNSIARGVYNLMITTSKGRSFKRFLSN